MCGLLLLGSQSRAEDNQGGLTSAEMLVTDHTKVNEELKMLAISKKVDLSAVIDPKDAGNFQKLEKFSGAEFDKEYLGEVISIHKNAWMPLKTSRRIPRTPM